MKVGNVCTKHPELNGRRYQGGNCPACVKARRSTPEGKAKHQEQYRAWRVRNPERARELDNRWRRANPHVVRANNLRRIGFTPALFAQALEAQDHRCAVCRQDLREMKSKAVHADHCHATGLPRGVLCHHCNAGLGAFRDDPELLASAIAYLANPTLSLA
jgi:hypothetical protein